MGEVVSRLHGTRRVIVYLHSFNSSPASGKSVAMGTWMAARGLADAFWCPQLANAPTQAMAEVEAGLARRAPASLTLVGSSLGGFYATYLTEKYGCKAVLVNPAVRAHVLLRAALGPQKNWHSGEEWTLTEAHLAELATFHVETITRPERYLLLAQTGDEVLDTRDAVTHYAGCKQRVEDGGDHGFAGFERHFQTILDF